MATPVILPTPSPEKRYQCRIEELPTLSEFLIESLERDMADFSAHSPVYNSDYLIAFRARRDEVIGLISPRTVTDHKKIVTADLYAVMGSMRGALNKLDNYVMLASTRRTLTVLPADFGISRVRRAIANGDAEETDGAMKILRRHITDNFTALSDMGYTLVQRDGLYDLWNRLNSDNANQNLKDDERDSIAGRNTVKYNQLWDIMVEVCASGKAIYEIELPEKTDEYTMRLLINRMRNEDASPRNKTFAIPKAASITLLNAADQTQGINSGKTRLSWRDLDAEEVQVIEPGETFLLRTTNGSILVTNLHLSREGKITIKVFRNTP